MMEEPSKPRYKLDWYQTESQVVLSVLAKNLATDKVTVDIRPTEILFCLVFADGSELQKLLQLGQAVVPERSSYKTLSSKVELKLIKKEPDHWTKLEKEEEDKPRPVKEPRNWDKVVSEIEDEKPEDEAVINNLFQKIYAEGSDEVKKAMNKSFMESGGTELNTNWDAVSKKKVDIKPPDGMEWKSWDS